jgi:hypothetical protein
VNTEPCTAPTLSSTAKKACGCKHATEAQPAPVFVEQRGAVDEPVHFSPAVAEPEFPFGLVVLLAGAAALAWTRQRLGARLVRLHLARPEPARERRRFPLPRLVPSPGERRALGTLRALFGRVPVPVLAPLRAAISRRATGR